MPKRETLTAEQVVAALQKNAGRVYRAADELKVAARTVYRYAERHESVREAIEHLKGRRLDTAEDRLWDAVEAGESWAICFYLKTQGKHRGYVERTETELGASGSLVDGLAEVFRRVDAQRRETSGANPS